MYRINNNPITNLPCSVNKGLAMSIPFDPDNTDYQQFKRDLAAGAALTDAEDADMTAEQIAAFLKGLV
jgi:hypothetical protein